MEAMRARGVVFATFQESVLSQLETNDKPTALLPIANKPLLHYPLNLLLDADVRDITVVCELCHTSAILTYVQSAFKKAHIDVHGIDDDVDTADALRELRAPKSDECLIVLGAGLVTTADLKALLARHADVGATCTAMMAPCSGAKTFAVTDPSSARLLGLYYASDLGSSAELHVRGALLARFPTLRVRSDVDDVHAYVLSKAAFEVLVRRPAASSLRFDLVPYLARRQFTLSRTEDLGDAIVCAYEAGHDEFVARITNGRQLVAANVAATKGAFGEAPVRKGKGKPAPPPLKQKGDRTSVSADSIVGSQVVAGDRTSIKKCTVGHRVVLGSQVKLNGCVVADDVTVMDGSNLNSTFLAPGCTVAEGCKLKECEVASGFTVPKGTTASNKTFSVQDVADEDDESDLGDDIVFE